MKITTPHLRDPVVQELREQARITPDAERRLRTVLPGGDFSGGTLAYYVLTGPRRGSMHLNPEWSRSGMGTMPDDVRRSRDAGWLTPSGVSPPQQVVAHEYGHHLLNEVTRHATLDELQELRRTINRHLRLSMENPILGPDFETKLDRAVAANATALQQSVSTYGAQSAHELIAEIWQEYSTLGNEARPHIREVGSAVRRLAEEASQRGTP